MYDNEYATELDEVETIWQAINDLTEEVKKMRDQIDFIDIKTGKIFNEVQK